MKNPFVTHPEQQACEHSHSHEHAHTHDHGHEHASHDHHHDHEVQDACCAGQTSEARKNQSHPDAAQDDCCGSAACAAPGARPAAPLDRGMLLHVPAMDCAVEENQIRVALQDVSPLHAVKFDLQARTVFIDAPESVWSQVQSVIEKAGFENRVLDTAISPESIALMQRKAVIRHVVALIVAIAAELVHLLMPDVLTWRVAGMAVAAVAIGMAGFDVLIKGLTALRQLRLNINALMTVAVIGAFLIGDWPEAAMVMALYGIAELIEARAVNRARQAISGLLDLAPAYAQVLQPDQSWAEQAVQSVLPGAIVRVVPGERFAFDATVLEGVSSVDQSAITGESAAVEKSPGDSVFAGTVNQYGALTIRVTAAATDTVLAQIIEAVEQAQNVRAPIQRFVDRFAAVYTPAVFVLALLVVLTGPWLFGMHWMDSIYKGLVMLVIACPCALVISTPVTLVSGLTAATRMGVLVKGGVFLEQIRRLRSLAVDKTGTLTQGQPRLIHAEPWQEGGLSAEAGVLPLDLAKILSSRSDHPVSAAIYQGLLEDAALAATNGSNPAEPDVSAVTAVPGKGLQAQIQGKTYRLGNHRWIHELGLCSSQLEEKLAEFENLGQTVSLLADEQHVLMIFAVADTLRETSRAAVAELQSMGVQVVMLTGDNRRTAHVVASQAGIDVVRAELLPQDKQQHIGELLALYGRPVGMVGDGINDAPALTQADIGIAMGRAGTDIAINAADVVIMSDDLRRIPMLMRLSGRVYRILWQNISLALGIKLIFLVLAMMNQATMWMAVFADMGASLLVVANGLRVLKGTSVFKAKASTTPV